MGLSPRSRLSLALIKRKLPSMMAADALAGLPEGLHVGIVGSGSPLPDRKRGNACVVVVAGEKVWVVDAGERASETLNRMQISAGRVEGVLLTHFHSDHIGGLPGLNLQRWVAEESSTPMRVLGPPGVERVIAGFNQAYALDSGYRTAHHGPEVADPATGAMVAETFEVPEAAAVVLEDSGLTVTAFPVDHTPASPAVGFRFDYAGRSAVISGDTSYVPELVEASRGADLLVHDALSTELLGLVERAAADAGRDLRSRILGDVTDYHATPAQAADAAREAGVGALALTHIIPPLPLAGLEAAFLGDAPERFDGPLWLATDGDLYSLPARGGLERTNLLPRR